MLACPLRQRVVVSLRAFLDAAKGGAPYGVKAAISIARLWREDHNDDRGKNRAHAVQRRNGYFVRTALYALNFTPS